MPPRRRYPGPPVLLGTPGRVRSGALRCLPRRVAGRSEPATRRSGRPPTFLYWEAAYTSANSMRQKPATPSTIVPVTTPASRPPRPSSSRKMARRTRRRACVRRSLDLLEQALLVVRERHGAPPDKCDHDGREPPWDNVATAAVGRHHEDTSR